MKRFSLNVKIWFIVCLFIIGSVAISYIGINSLQELNASISEINKLHVVRMQRVYRIQSTFREIALRQGFYLSDQTKEGRAKFANGISQSAEKIDKELADAIEQASEKGRPKYLEVQEIWRNWQKKAIEARRAADEENDALARELNLDCREMRTSADEHLQDLVEVNESSLESEGVRAGELYYTSRNLTIGISASTILIASLLAFFILRSTSTAIQAVITSLNEGASQVNSAAAQISSSSVTLSQAATEQAASLEQTAASVEEMNSMISKNSENAKQVAGISGESHVAAINGKEAVDKMIQSMDEISTSNNNIMEQVNESNNQIAEIVKVITEIGNKTKVINDIVFQTKLLSFNASVEAARAGEHGKGFAVVAEEVGSLAQMSGNAAKEISSMLETSIQRVESIVNDTKTKVGSFIQSGKVKVESGAEIAKQCGEVLNEIVQKISQVTEMAKEISTATSEQARGIQEITKAMSQLDQVTQQNAAASEEAASSSEELSAQADSLKGSVSTLVLTINGSKGTLHEHRIQLPPPVAQKPILNTKNIIHLKPKPVTDLSQTTFKKAVGDVPDYNDSGFEDV